jgi:hypothetical protein
LSSALACGFRAKPKTRLSRWVRVRSAFTVALVVLASCSPTVPQHGPSASILSFEPSADPSQVSAVVHLHLASTSLGSVDAALFQGSLSDYYLTRIKHGEVPDTLAARQVSVIGWRAETELILAPVAPLPAGPYSLAAASGLLGEFQVGSALPLLRRVWPTPGVGGSPHYAVYCGDAADTPTGGPLSLEPGDVSVTLSPGVDDDGAFADRCLHFSCDIALDPAAILVPWPVVGAWAPDPSPFSASVTEPARPLTCSDGEVAVGLGCAMPADDRAIVRTPAASLLWIVHSAHGAFVEVTQPSASFVVRGLVPSSHEHLWGTIHDESGAESNFDLFIDTIAARARPVLNEVLANPLGPEPLSEWIEVVNDGSLPAQLSDYRLQDGGGITALPEATLAPQEYALLVRNDFVPNASDVPPAPGCRLIRMPELGKSGLSNSGERLVLLDADGQQCSVVPALPANPGLSLARRHPWSLDGDLSAFSFGTPTPGVANDGPAVNAAR